MTISEMEERSGLTRANIRFYEAEGLLCPSRRENGYRDYSQKDLQLLLKIRLLRTLRVPLEQIRELQAGKLELSSVLERQLSNLQREEQDIAQSRAVCARMYSDGARFDTLDAARYLAAQDVLSQKTVPAADAVEPVRAPWRRFFARDLDLMLYGLLWTIVLGLCKVNVAERSAGLQLLDNLAAVLLMLAVEPFLLSRFGTTLGKWVFGLGVTDLDGGRLSYQAAFERLKMLIWRGFGLFLPIYNLVRLWKSYRECSDGLMLDWDGESTVTLRRGKTVRCVAGIAGILAVVFCGTVLAIGFSELPWHRGDLTVAEFCENYNQLARHYDISTGYQLDREGRWTQKPDTTIVIGGSERPEFVFTEDDGIMTGMHFTLEERGGENGQYGYQNQILLAVLAFVRAQPGGGMFSKEAVSAAQQIGAAGLQDYSFTACGVEIAYEIRYCGYTALESMNTLCPEEGEQTYYAISFSMQKR